MPTTIKILIGFFVLMSVGVMIWFWVMLTQVQEAVIEERKDILQNITQETDDLNVVLKQKEEDLKTAELYKACMENGYYGGANGVIVSEEENYVLCQEVLVEWQRIGPTYMD